MSIPRLIGLTAAAGAGKDTLADHLQERFGHVKYALASPLKQMLNARFGWTDVMWEDRVWKESATGQVSGFSPRSWAQWLGTDVCRNLAGKNVWVDLAVRKWYSANGPEAMVIPDVRFDNEAEAIRAMGGVVLKIVRGAATPINPHVSENGVQPELVDAIVPNDRSVDDFLLDAISVLSKLERRSADVRENFGVDRARGGGVGEVGLRRFYGRGCWRTRGRP